MKRTLTAIALTLVLAGCGKACQHSSPAPGAATQSATAAGPFVQKGVAADKIIVGYVQDNADPSKCSVVTDAPAGKEVFARAGDDYAKLVDGKVVPSCPTDNVVGTCDNGFGLLTNYSGPKWTTVSAKRNCTGKAGRKWENRKWVE